MQRHEMIEVLGQLGLKGMAGAFDDAVTTGLQRNRTAMEMLSDLLRAETAPTNASSAAATPSISLAQMVMLALLNKPE